MGITLRIPGAAFVHYVASEWPQPADLAALFLMQTPEADALVNQVDPDAPATVGGGTPTYDATGAALSQTNWIDTNAGGSTENLTLWGIFKLPASGDHMYIGNYASGTGDSILAVTTGTALRASGAGGGGAASAGITTVGIGTDWFFGAAVFSEAATTIYKGHAGVLSSSASGGDRSPLDANDFRLGRGVTAFTTQPASHMLDGIHHRALSASDIGELFAFCQEFAEALGVTDLTS